MSLVKQLADLALGDPEPRGRRAPAFVTAPVADAAMQASPIEPSWVLTGQPHARACLHSKSADGFASTTVWDCTAGSFRWRFDWDETVMILEGSVTVTDETGQVTMLNVGDAAFFAAGSWATWEVRSYVRKLAFCRKAFPAPVAAAINLKTWIVGLVRGRAAPAGLGAPAPVTARGS